MPNYSQARTLDKCTRNDSQKKNPFIGTLFSDNGNSVTGGESALDGMTI